MIYPGKDHYITLSKHALLAELGSIMHGLTRELSSKLEPLENPYLVNARTIVREVCAKATKQELSNFCELLEDLRKQIRQPRTA